MTRLRLDLHNLTNERDELQERLRSSQRALDRDERLLIQYDEALSDFLGEHQDLLDEWNAAFARYTQEPPDAHA